MPPSCSCSPAWQGGAPTFTLLKAKSTRTDPRRNLVYEPSDTQTYYLSWGRSATPQGTGIVANATGIAAATSDLAPEKKAAFETSRRTVMKARFAGSTIAGR